MAAEPSYQRFLADLQPGTRTDLGRPIWGPVSKRWIFPVRHVLRDDRGAVRAVLSSSMPVEFLEEFWRKAPVVAKATIGLIRDDGYLLSRFPTPPSVGLDRVYGEPRKGALVNHLMSRQFPDTGYAEGAGELAGTELGFAYVRFEHFPMTLFVAMPKHEFRLAWWRRVRMPYLLVALLAGIGSLGLRSAMRRQREWVAERQRSELTLRESEREQRFLIDHLQAGVIVHAPDGSVQQVNAQACLLMGLSEAQMLGRALVDPTWRFVREDGSVMPLAEFPVPRVLQTLAPQRALVLGVMKDDRAEPVWLYGDAFPQTDAQGGLLRVVVTFVDISNRLRAEKALAINEVRFRLLYENNLDGVLQTRMDGSILAANQAACSLFRQTEDELRRLGRGGLTDPGDPRLARLLAARERDGHARGELTMLRGDGSSFEAEVASVIYTDPTGQRITSVVVHDVTDRRRAEAAVAARDLAEEANRAKSEFMARMSHELRTPLNAILGFSEVLDLDTEHPLQALQQERLRHVRDAGGHLLLLINDLLDLSRIESGSMRLNIDRVDVLAVAQDAVGEMSTQAQAQDIHLHCDLAAEPIGWVHGDRSRIKQVLLNLLSNAIKYNRPGGRVRVSLEVTASRARLTVKDTGMGLNAAQIQALFQPFNRLGREHSAVEGTGIGLVVSRSLVELMGGHISVHSEPGQGAEFVVDLPLAAEPQGAPATPPGPAPADPRASAIDGGPDGHILYIDDDEVNRVLMQALIELRPGLQLHLANNGPEGLALAAHRPPDLVLIDMMMPDMNGLQVLHRLRNTERLRDTPCVAVSANAMPHQIEAALAAGFDGYLTKPLSSAALMAEIDRAMTLPRPQARPHPTTL